MAQEPYTSREIALDLPNFVDGGTIMRRRVVCRAHTLNTENRTVSLDVTERFYSLMPDGSCGKEWPTQRIQRPLEANNFSIVNLTGKRIGRKGVKSDAEWAAELAALDAAGTRYMGQGDFFMKTHDATPVIIADLKLQYMATEFLPTPPAAPAP